MYTTVNGYKKYEGFTYCGRLETMAKDMKAAIRNFRYQLMQRGLNRFKASCVEIGDVRVCA